MQQLWMCKIFYIALKSAINMVINNTNISLTVCLDNYTSFLRLYHGVCSQTNNLSPPFHINFLFLIKWWLICLLVWHTHFHFEDIMCIKCIHKVLSLQECLSLLTLEKLFGPLVLHQQNHLSAYSRVQAKK